jgi:hypothetical protein
MTSNNDVAVAPEAESKDSTPIAVNNDFIPKYEREVVPVIEEEESITAVSILTPVGLFDSDIYPATCYPTWENFTERYAKSIRLLWNINVKNFLHMTQEFDWRPWAHLRIALEEADSNLKVGAVLSFPSDVNFEADLKKIWESNNVQSLYERHMEIIEISTWTAAIQYQGDIDYVAELNKGMLNHIAALIWDNDPNFALLFAVQQHIKEQNE